MPACTGAPAAGKYTKMLIEPGASPHTFDSSSERYEILPGFGPAENVQSHGRLIGGQGITGVHYPISTRIRQGGHYVYGKFSLNPSPGYFNTLLPYLVGDESTDVFTPKACPNGFGMLIWRDDETYPWEIKDCKVDKWTLQARAPQFREQGAPELLVLTVDVIGLVENALDDSSPTSWPGTEPSLPTGATYYPYILQDSDSAFTLGGAPQEVYAFKLTYDNQLKVLYANSLTAQAVTSRGRMVTLQAVLPWDATTDGLYDKDNYTGAAASMVFTQGSYSTTFTINNLKIIPESPYTMNEEEIVYEINAQAYGTPTAAEITVTNDVTA